MSGPTPTYIPPPVMAGLPQGYYGQPTSVGPAPLTSAIAGPDLAPPVRLPGRQLHFTPLNPSDSAAHIRPPVPPPAPAHPHVDFATPPPEDPPSHLAEYAAHPSQSGPSPPAVGTYTEMTTEDTQETVYVAEEPSRPPKKRKRKGQANEPPNHAPKIHDQLPMPRTENLRKPEDPEDGNLIVDALVHRALTMMKPVHLAAMFQQRAIHYWYDVEVKVLDGKFIPEKAWVDTTIWPKSRSLDDLPDFLVAFGTYRKTKLPLGYAPHMMGAPHTIVVALSAVRAGDLIRTLRCFQSKDSVVGKLFAKHIKLEEAVRYLDHTRHVPISNPHSILGMSSLE
ncbi:MAG: hypothetical protein M1838_000259 [Thelocarpon superellum]|nr:MAG: hypothetical protein M1838_000259 [Thelocarpon superellum]